MRVAIVGCRRKFIPNPRETRQDVFDLVSSLPPDTVVISGGEPTGVDFWAAQAARKYGLKLIEHFAKWRKPDGSMDRSAGFKRNVIVERDSDEVHAFWDRLSPGTGHTIGLFNDAGKRVVIHEIST